MSKKCHLIVVGFDEIVLNKYLGLVDEAIKDGVLDGFSIVDLAKEREEIEKRLARALIQPEKTYYLQTPDLLHETEQLSEFDGIARQIQVKHGEIKVYIATEVRYHERYLKYCVEHGISCLIEKPVFLPQKDGKYCPELMVERMAYYVEQAEKNHCRVSVMTLGRCHEIYADVVYRMIEEKMQKYQAPLTSFHIKHAGGVWNLHREYLTREDHPYRYGYGMLMHGGYHYVDLLACFLLLNKMIYPEKQFEIAFSSYAAFPTDQNDRIPKPISERFDDNCPDWWKKEGKGIDWGETDITSTFCLRDKETKRVITLGTIAMEQTTPSVRTWTEFPEGLYNKNGRVSNLDMEIQLSTLFAASVKCYKIPRDDGKFVEHVPVKPHIITRANPKLLPDEEYETKKVYPEVYNSTSNKRIMTRWLRDEETVSALREHLPVMKLMQTIAFSLEKQGESIVADF